MSLQMELIYHYPWLPSLNNVFSSIASQDPIEFIKETEKAGLVHNTIWDKGYESSHFICNCCSCHCGAIFPSKLLGLSENESAIQRSNFAPKRYKNCSFQTLCALSS